jgi:hypothetical protein
MQSKRMWRVSSTCCPSPCRRAVGAEALCCRPGRSAAQPVGLLRPPVDACTQLREGYAPVLYVPARYTACETHACTSLLASLTSGSNKPANFHCCRPPLRPCIIVGVVARSQSSHSLPALNHV